MNLHCPVVNPSQIRNIITFICGTLTLEGAPHINAASLKQKGFLPADLKKVEEALRGVFDLRFAFSPWNLGEKTMVRLGFDEARASEPGFDVLEALGFTQNQIDEANDELADLEREVDRLVVALESAFSYNRGSA